jgi:hypothetical protein
MIVAFIISFLIILILGFILCSLIVGGENEYRNKK